MYEDQYGEFICGYCDLKGSRKTIKKNKAMNRVLCMS